MKITQLIKDHEKLIIVAIVSLTIWGGYTRLLNYLELRDQRASTASQIALQSQIDTNKKLSDEVEHVRQDYQNLKAEYEAKNVQLEGQIKKRDVQVVVQQEKDKTLQPVELASRWSLLINQPVETIKPTETGYQIEQAPALMTVLQLELIPQLQQDLNDTRQIVSNKDVQINGLNGVVTSLTGQVDGLNQQIVKQNTASKDEIALIKAQARKSKLRWFIAGFVTGLATRFIH